MSLALAVLPIVLMVALGYLLRATKLVPPDQWQGIETLSFRVLIPAVLVLAITGSDLSHDRFGPVIWLLLASWFLLALLALCLRLLPLSRLGNPAFTSLFQTSTRWNAFVPLAAAEQFGGPEALAILALAMGLLIPIINVVCILILSAFGPTRARPSQILLAVVRNPMVQACALGLFLWALDVTLPTFVAESLDMLGRGALAIGLLAVGAGISLRRLARWRFDVALGLLMRPLLAPALCLALAMLFFKLPAPAVLACLFVFAAPAAANGYIIARQMGGDADLYADILSWQTILSLAVLPLWAAALV